MQIYAGRKFCSSCVNFNVVLKFWFERLELGCSFFLETALFAAAVNFEMRPVNFEDVFPSIAHRFKLKKMV